MGSDLSSFAERFPDVPPLTEILWSLLAQVPTGHVTTCGDLADALGNRVAAAWIGHLSLHHDHTPECHCHRIVRAGGQLGGYVTGSIDEKVEKLAQEGVLIRDGVIDLDEFGVREFVSDRPLEALRRVQEVIQRQIVLEPRQEIPELVAGVDVAYPEPGIGVAAYALVETATGRLVWSTTVRRRVAFPYITTYLSFREIPILLELLDEVQATGFLAEVLMVDGNGILHQRHAGIASHLGVLIERPTVGVTKSLLCGDVDMNEMAPGDVRPVTLEGHQIGSAMRMTSGSRRPVFLSPGHAVDVAFCERLARILAIGRRLPAPIHLADRLSRSRR
jgi:deoxyribonuclease V